ncbi:MAG: hypothetical protein EBY76_11045, partial [Betaproteobacteria bacterium]|nr:hypothetical protein [Betaproteobacteria bacterium]
AFAAQNDKLFNNIKSKLFSKVNSSENSCSEIEQEVTYQFSSLFKKHYEELSYGNFALSEEIGRHAIKNLTSKWLSIRKGLPIEIPLTIDQNNLKEAPHYLTDLVGNPPFLQGAQK